MGNTLAAFKNSRVAPSAAKVTPSKRRHKRQRPPLRAVVHLIHRFLILVAALAYIVISLQSAIYTSAIIKGDSTPTTSGGPYAAEALAQSIGTAGRLRNSPLVVDSLADDTQPREGMLYLEMDGSSFERCGAITPVVDGIYADEFLRLLFAALVRDAAYAIPLLADIELVVPIIDCTADLLVDADETIALFNLLVRKRTHIDDVFMLSITFANQIYEAPARKTRGPAGVATLTFVNDLDARHVDVYYVISTGYPYRAFDFRVFEHVGTTSDGGLWELQKIPNPRDPIDQVPLVIRTGTRSGFFAASEASQANMFSELWVVSDTDPVAAITGCDWVSKSVLVDLWAYVHYVHVLFALELLASLVVLTMVAYSNYVHAGKLWIGDAFVGVSRRGGLRALLVLLTWYVNGFWTLLEFVVHDVNHYSDLSTVVVRDTIVFVDLLTLYLGVCGLLGKLCRERVDPLVALIGFSVSYAYRFELTQLGPRATETDLADFYAEFYNLALAPLVDGHAKISPMRFWSVHALQRGDIPLKYIMIVLAPMLASFGIVLLLLAAKKIYRQYYPDPLHIMHTAVSTATTQVTGARQADRNGVDDAALHAQKSVLTIFEIATGAKLATRFGLLAEYDHCLFLKGMKFATPDGVYSNGFVVANERYLLRASDVYAIALMKLLRVRFTTIYMYEVTGGTTVDKVARLVYPHSLTLRDLLTLNTNILS